MNDRPNNFGRQVLKPDLCVIGAGAAGLSVASSAALIGASVVLIEKGEMGGDCLNRGCVPSKALIAAAHAVHAGREAKRFGIHFGTAHVDGAAVLERVRAVIGSIAPVDSVARYRALGVTVVEGEAQFAGPGRVVVGETGIEARRFVIATGAAPVIPRIPGIDAAPVLTSDDIFTLSTLPRRLAILGGGAIGVELAQACRRLGVEVTIIEAATLLAREDADAAALMRQVLKRDGVQIFENASVTRIDAFASGASLDLTGTGVPAMLNAGHILVAAGRAPRLDGLRLDLAGVASTDRGISVDHRLRTSNRAIYAIGDCIEGPRFTHAAAYQAGLVVRNALFHLPVRVDYSALPRVIYADPEVASVGLDEAAARVGHGGVQTLRWPFSENDRARTDGATEGFVKAFVDARERILGAVIVGRNAGELIAPWGLAIGQKLKIDAMIDLVLPYPTLSEASRRAAVQSLLPRLRSPWPARLVRWARLLG